MDEPRYRQEHDTFILVGIRVRLAFVILRISDVLR